MSEGTWFGKNLFGNMEGSLYENSDFLQGVNEGMKQEEDSQSKDRLKQSMINGIAGNGIANANMMGMSALGKYKDMSMFGQNMQQNLISMALGAGRPIQNQLPYQDFMQPVSLFNTKGGGYGSL